MWSSPEFLRLCSELKLKFPHKLEEGQKVGRGFADLGFEEFLILPGNKILSLYSGTSSILKDEDSLHLFWIPSCDELVESIHRLGWEINQVEFRDQRQWHLTIFKRENGRSLDTAADSLECALINGLLGTFEK